MEARGPPALILIKDFQIGRGGFRTSGEGPCPDVNLFEADLRRQAVLWPQQGGWRG